MAWTEERKQEIIEKYQEAGPTAENSTEICKQIADEMKESANGIRMILIHAGVYIKKAEPSKGKTSGSSKTGDKPARVSKEDQIAALRAAIEESGKTVDDEILTKLTGKAAVYFLSILKD